MRGIYAFLCNEFARICKSCRKLLTLSANQEKREKDVSSFSTRKINRQATRVYIYGRINPLKQQVTPHEGADPVKYLVFSVACKLKQRQKSPYSQGFCMRIYST